MGRARITGSILYRQRIALPPGAIVRVRLEDVSRQDVPAPVLGTTEVVTEGEQVPVPFLLEADLAGLDAHARPALRATIEIAGALRFATTGHQPLPGDGGTDAVVLLVDPVRAPEPEPTLGGVAWTLVELGGRPLELGEGERAPSLVFDVAASRVSGSGGCNRLTGSVETDARDCALRLGPIASTMMGCAEKVMARERAFVAALEVTTGFRLAGETLELLDGERVLAVLRSAPLTPLA